MGRKQRLSKKGKKNQRKNTDISDVEQLLLQNEKNNLEGGPIEMRLDSQLFFTDVGDTQAISKKELWKKKELSYERILKPNPHVPLMKGSTIPKRKKDTK